MDHLQTLQRAISFEIEMMGNKADKKLSKLFNTPREMLELAKEYISNAKPNLGDALHFITKLEYAFYGTENNFETILRLIELRFRLIKEWRLATGQLVICKSD